MIDPSKPQPFSSDGIIAPLRFRTYRRVWVASLLAISAS